MKTYEEILNHVLNAGSNSLYVFGGKFEGGYELQQDPDDITSFLFDYQGKEVENFIEIGVAAGGNTRIMCDFLNIKNVYTMDLDEHPSINSPNNPNAREKNFQNLKISGERKSFYGDSHSENALQWLNEQGVKFDIAFIDGDHTFDGIKMDTELIIPFMKENGLLIYHDTIIDVGSLEFDKKLKTGLFPQLKLVKDYTSNNRTSKGISVYRYEAN